MPEICFRRGDEKFPSRIPQTLPDLMADDGFSIACAGRATRPRGAAAWWCASIWRYGAGRVAVERWSGAYPGRAIGASVRVSCPMKPPEVPGLWRSGATPVCAMPAGIYPC